MGTFYPHMCRDGHAEIGFDDSRTETCPVCDAVAMREAMRNELRVTRTRPALSKAAAEALVEIFRVQAIRAHQAQHGWPDAAKAPPHDFKDAKAALLRALTRTPE